ncbi:hypothetical protein DPMN_090434 [Dreissena polymorpha]|uniref:Uncharacterized protein n=1 Tax=Dreissena polymorpha TaxID=45954 RepID=A0A9D4QY76_DREPO|nr:hypothetical protein DPMN_090434 [Dreissena polymorpha]
MSLVNVFSHTIGYNWHLNITVVIDCVDKQDVTLARRVFAEDVETVIAESGFKLEAQFCRLIRRWYDAEDEPAVPAVEMCRRRYELLQWLRDGYQLGIFPPPTKYVKGIPIITYEALIAHLVTKLQLFARVPHCKYNVRATGTQELEQLFSSFRDVDPSGTGTVKPDVIPRMLASAIEVDNFRLNPTSE